MNLKRRLKKNEEFKEVIDCRVLVKTKSCNIFFKKTAEPYKFGVSVSKKLGNAVIRNLTKRRIRAILREIDDSKFIYNHNLVIIAKSPILQMTYQELKNDLEKPIIKRFIGDQNEKIN